MYTRYYSCTTTTSTRVPVLALLLLQLLLLCRVFLVNMPIGVHLKYTIDRR